YAFKGSIALSFFKRLCFIWRLCFESRARCRRTFIGDFNVSYFHYVARAVGSEEVVFLDDGAATLNTYSDYLSKNRMLPQRDSVELDFIESIVFFPFSSPWFKSKSFSLFTSYDLKSVDGLVVVNNNFEYLKGVSKEAKVEKAMVWLIGSPYSEIGIMDMESELLLIKKAVRFLVEKGCRVEYYAHRRDSSQKLNKINGLEGVSALKRSTFPVEYEYCINTPARPSSIAGFYTTALGALAELGRFDDIYSFEFPDKFLSENIRRVYAYYRSRGFCVVTL